MKIFVIIPTFGRKALLSRVLAHLEQQTRLPDEVIVSAPDESHVDQTQSPCFKLSFLFGRQGSSAQRNQALDAGLGKYDIATFFDDDFLPADDYLEQLESAFCDHPDWVVITSHPAIDGAKGAGLTFDEGLAALHRLKPPVEPRVEDHLGAYGCNMSVRADKIGDLRFDERLVLYGWQEDIDFSSQMRRYGRIVSLNTLRGVHLGVKSGRVSGVRFGYSQFANPVYLVRKGTVPRKFAYELMCRNLAANLLRSCWSEPHIDRWGRLKGNILAAWHIMRGRVEPEHILKL